jgi:ribosomal protein L37AE/L43A
LRDLKALTAGPAKRPTPRIGRKFTTEHECETYLLARMRETPFRCPRCGHESASWLAARRVWQCDECRRQTGLRAGTILERSRVSLLAWFSTIECVIADPSASLAVIAAAAGLSRMTTLRDMVWRIRDALASSAASQRLAGLDVYFGNRPRAASAIAELSVP